LGPLRLCSCPRFGAELLWHRQACAASKEWPTNGSRNVILKSCHDFFEVLKERRVPELKKKGTFLHEANLLRRLQHPNIIECYGMASMSKVNVCQGSSKTPMEYSIPFLNMAMVETSRSGFKNESMRRGRVVPSVLKKQVPLRRRRVGPLPPPLPRRRVLALERSHSSRPQAVECLSEAGWLRQGLSAAAVKSRPSLAILESAARSVPTNL
jgi:hypothetical protein